MKDALDLIDKRGPLSAAAQLDRARLLDKLERHEEAWTGFVQAKARLAREMGAQYDASQVEAESTALKAVFTRETLARLPRASVRPGPQPIFILGFPRSGTTMIEQMLNSHPDVAAGGELPFVHEWRALIENVLPGKEGFPVQLAHIEAADYHHIPGLMRDHYLGRAETYGVTRDSKPLFTDKMPLNDAHLPLIRLAFPHAPIIRMVRHPLDVAVSMLSHNLTHGHNSGYAIDSIIRHMVTMHDLTTHYDEVLEHPALTVN